MSIPWIIPGALAAALVLLAVRAFGPRLFAGMLTWRYAFRCPFKAQNVNAEFQETVWDGRRLDVERCSAFTPPESVSCNKACTLFARFPRPEGRAVPPAG